MEMNFKWCVLCLWHANVRRELDLKAIISEIEGIKNELNERKKTRLDRCIFRKLIKSVNSIVIFYHSYGD